jgi:hypothetical protein
MPTAATSMPNPSTNSGRIRCASRGAIRDPATTAPAWGTSASPACAAVSPSTIWMYWLTSMKTPPMVSAPTSMMHSAAVKVRLRNSARSSIGSASRCCRRANTTPAARPASSTTAVVASGPFLAISFSANTIGRIVASDSATLARSRRPAFSSRYSGSSLGAVTSSNTMTGTASRNTAPHHATLSSSPPTTGPMTMPPMKQLIHTAIAVPR